MTALDWIIVALTLTTAVAGYFQGFVVGAATLAGFAAGLFVGARVGQAVVSAGSESPYAPLFGLAGALIGGMLFGSVLERLGYGLRRRVTAPSLGLVDGLAGAAAGHGGGAGAGVARRLRGAAVAPDARPARRHPALEHPAHAQRRAAAVGPDPQCAGAL